MKTSVKSIIAVVALLVVGLTAWIFAAPYFNQRDAIWAAALTSEEKGFRFEYPHTVLSVEGAEYDFQIDGSFEDLLSDLQSAYPEGEVTSENTWQIGIEKTVFVISKKADYLELRSQLLTVDAGEPDADLITFPVTAFQKWAGEEAPKLKWDQSYPTDWDLTEWRDFYALTNTATATNGGVQTVNSFGEPVYIYIAEGEFVITERLRTK